MVPVKQEGADHSEQPLKKMKLGKENSGLGLKGLGTLPGKSAAPDSYILATKVKGELVGKINGALDRQPTRGEFNSACRLYRDGAGNYFPSPLAFKRIPVPEEMREKWKNLPDKEQNSERFRYKLDVWQRENSKLGITGVGIFSQKDDQYKTNKNGRLNPEDKILKTPHGDRRVMKRYQHTFQAGTELPDIMIKATDGSIHFMHRSANDKFAGKGFEEFRNDVLSKHGDKAEIKLKSESGIMHDANYLEAWEKGNADRRFRRYAGEFITHNPELPLATVNIGRRDDGNGGFTRDHHISISELRSLADPDKNPNPDTVKDAARLVNSLEKGDHWDRVQVRTRDGNGYRTTPRMDYNDRDHFKSVMEQVGLPEEMGKQRLPRSIKLEGFEMNAPALVQVGGHLRDARDLDPGELADIDQKQILIADRNDQNQLKGTYTSMAEYESRARSLPDEAARALGKQTGLDAMDVANPEPAAPPIYDRRPDRRLAALGR